MKRSRIRLNSGYAICLVAALAGCATEVGNPKRPKGGGGGTANDETFALNSEIVSSQLDETMTTVTGDVAGLSLTSPSFSLESDSNSFLLEPQRNCILGTPPTTATSTVEASHNKTETITRRGVTIEATIAASRNVSNVWNITSGSGELSCTTDNAVKVPWLQVDAVTLVSTSHRVSDRSLHLPDAFENNTMKRRHVDVHSGANITHTRTTASGSTVIEKSASFTSTYTFELEKSNGKTINLTSNVTTDEDAPIITRMVFEGTPLPSMVSRTIVSGSQTATRSDGKTIKMTYSNIVFSSVTNCSPNSGTITGKVLGPDDTEEETFTVTFTSGIGKIKFRKLNKEDSYIQECLR